MASVLSYLLFFCNPEDLLKGFQGIVAAHRILLHVTNMVIRGLEGRVMVGRVMEEEWWRKGRGKEKRRNLQHTGRVLELRPLQYDSLFPISRPHHFVASHAFVHYLITWPKFSLLWSADWARGADYSKWRSWTCLLHVCQPSGLSFHGILPAQANRSTPFVTFLWIHTAAYSQHVWITGYSSCTVP